MSKPKEEYAETNEGAELQKTSSWFRKLLLLVVIALVSSFAGGLMSWFLTVGVSKILTLVRAI